MTYRRDEFKSYLAASGLSTGAINTYVSYVNRCDPLIEGLDEALQKDGVDKMLAWLAKETRAPFDTYPSQARTSVNKYIQFFLAKEAPVDPKEEDLVQDEANANAAGLAFRLEKEMHAAVRKQLANIESGLIEDDGGKEVSVATGYIDIVARDTQRKLVVIELKAGKCPPGAMEQALGYAQALSDERGEDVRVLLIAAEFPDRIKAAAKRTVGLKLLNYEFSLKFRETS
ncbi:endonuclease NucS domain-containing protein [Tardiphaga sp. 841_E9_N1_2]|jgi:hypothetical protein|uniref:endonuclease NucS domain-containing protein n=1 Tax=unclassified Tardiphaga TaxID=2631404 RepID=UPI003F25181C